MGTDFYYDWLNLGYKMAVSAGTDVPWQGSIGEVRMYAYVGDTPFSADAWFEAVRAGRTFVTNGPMLDFHVDEAMPGDQINVSGDRAAAHPMPGLGRSGVMVPTKLEIIRHGEVIKSVESTDAAKRELARRFRGRRRRRLLAGGEGHRQRRLAGPHDAGLRGARAVAVLEDRCGRVADRPADGEPRRYRANDRTTRQAKASGKADGNLTARTMAEQGDELLKRVAEAREFFRQLRQTAERECAARSPG